jgi:hypothetical protein
LCQQWERNYEAQNERCEGAAEGSPGHRRLIPVP